MSCVDGSPVTVTFWSLLATEARDMQCACMCVCMYLFIFTLTGPLFSTVSRGRKSLGEGKNMNMHAF